MANTANEVQRMILTRLGRELVAQVSLANNLLRYLTRYLEEMVSRDPEMSRGHSLLLDQAINSYGLHTLLMKTKVDVRVTSHLRAAREELLRSLPKSKNSSAI